jgi:cation transport regulator ChaC
MLEKYMYIYTAAPSARGVERLKFDDNMTYMTYTMNPGRPSSVRTRAFQRRLTDADAAILAHAGAGNISAGFRHLLALYQRLHAIGIASEPGCDIDNIIQKIGSER